TAQHPISRAHQQCASTQLQESATMRQSNSQFLETEAHRAEDWDRETRFHPGRRSRRLRSHVRSLRRAVESGREEAEFEFAREGKWVLQRSRYCGRRPRPRVQRNCAPPGLRQRMAPFLSPGTLLQPPPQARSPAAALSTSCRYRMFWSRRSEPRLLLSRSHRPCVLSNLVRLRARESPVASHARRPIRLTNCPI